MLRSDFLTDKLAILDAHANRGYFAAFHIRLAAPLHAFQTYDKAWTDHYTAQAYAMRDPTIAWGFSTEGVTRWSEITILDPFGIFDDAASYGLRFGIAVSVGAVTSRSIVGLARSDREFTDAEMDEVQEAVRSLHSYTEPPDSLTKAQTEALRLIAEGDRHTAAAAKLNISESALKARLTGARERLLARTTAEAIQRAKEYRLL